ncbi:pre-mRNA 3'-end-processing factor FIP1 [Sipha flava]|uniref:Pre-mRNA 3'-end-processing factor FIP1 n=3 Tax=Sipha flava TaxID=143950 RepID=A0A8B8G2Z3_9HEMI|nr:pre-mRNA 3'-end-processing factor FIP1 [Sipha flava]XP_025416966.1 pre-mRNA 3'-end-processing factor FIP1 [Sipha flava]
MADSKTEETIADNGDDDQWLYGDSNSNLDPVGTSVQDVKPTDFIGIVADEEARLMEFLANPGPGSIDVPPPVKELINDDPNRPRSPEIFLGGSGIQSESLVEPLKDSVETNTIETATEEDSDAPEKITEENNDDKEISSEDSEEDSDDDIVVAAGNFTLSSMETNMASLSQQNSSPSTAGINLKRNNLLTLTNIPGMSAGSKHQGKFNVEDFESMGTINGVPAHEYSIETTEEKPWLKPGADITDYFNYGFNENTWLAYCERQRKMRCNESLVGMATLAMHNQQTSTTTANNNLIPTLDVKSSPKFQTPNPPPKENTIEVMTAERREYSRKHFSTPDLSVPPPIIPTNFDVPPPMIPSSINSIPPPGFAPPPLNYEPEYYPHEPDPYYNAFEPTQDMQWNQSWNSNIKSIENIPTLANGDSYNKSRPDLVRDKEYYASRVKKEPEDRAYEREREGRNRYRERDRDRDRERERDRDRERSRHRESDGVESPETSYKEEREYKHKSHRHRSRSRSHEKRSRKHKSRSRSGSRHRHKKKKKKSEKNKEEDNSE